MRQVYVIGAGMVPFGKYPDTPLSELAARAINAALADAGMSGDEVTAAYVGSQWGGSMVGQRALKHTGMLGIPIINVENACSSGSTALHLAKAAVATGMHDAILVVGADKLSTIAGPLPRHPEDFDGTLGMSPPAAYASRARRYMHEFDALPEDLAQVCVKNRRHARENRMALFQAEVSIEEVLASRPVADPLTLLQCCARADGAAAVIVANEDWAGKSQNAPARILASQLCSGRYRGDFRDMTSPEISVRCAEKAYAEAGLTAGDIHLAEVHDAFSIAEMLYYEALGFCDRGAAKFLIREGATAIGGTLPVNPSGGLMAKGHPPGATGVAQVVEAVEQLRGHAGARQVKGAKNALTHCTGGGVSGLDHGACTIHILSVA
ncbi:thiolase family protein [Paracandidimonas lactea]|uniref:thiolase family protein n=1 Tax=Paracandidimonas lactea TaxID=2895524 RepID=UPI001F48BD2A|nr:thiolase family protein [Paracandidimonas lactea]